MLLKYSILLHKRYFEICYCRRLNHWTSRNVRSSFIEFFKDNDHKYIRSSPVIPWKDPSIDFVNAGMIQFKPIFLGHKRPKERRVVNSQKCIRLGGKHNDLAAVGFDTYHHTFFEMLGSWSFGDYFKETSCSLTWKLMTEVLKLPPERLYVTYFGGEKKLGIPADEEVYHIWASLGVNKNHILPFSMDDNFWEMGPIGPCGPCTEIHYDRFGRNDAASLVNKGTEDVIELWNLVFIQYERFLDGSLGPLKMHSVDTGMGLERITAVLNGRRSNYDTDLFFPLFDRIQKLSNAPPYSGMFSGESMNLDTSYRILADHARMITVSIADGIIPGECAKWTRIFNRTLTVGEEAFGLTSPDWLNSLMYTVGEILGDTYPEIWGQMNTAQERIRGQREIAVKEKDRVNKNWKEIVTQYPTLKHLSRDRSKSLINSIKSLCSKRDIWLKENNGNIPLADAAKQAVKNQNDCDIIEEIANSLDLKVDTKELEQLIQNMLNEDKVNTQKQIQNSDTTKGFHKVLEELSALNKLETNNDAKYIYNIDSQNNYNFPIHNSKIIYLVNKLGEKINNACKGEDIGIITESSNFYFTAGGQLGDVGSISNSKGNVLINNVVNMEGFLIHWGVVESGGLMINDDVELNIDEDNRLACSRHHTAIHLLNNVLKLKYNSAIQINSLASPSEFELTVNIPRKVESKDIQDIEDIIKKQIKSCEPIQRELLKINDALSKKVSIIPGFVYPENVSTITVHGEDDSKYTELCCGTHLLNTSHLHDFTITSCKHSGKRFVTISGICGPILEDIRKKEIIMMEKLPIMEKETKKNIHTYNIEQYDALIEEVEGFINMKMSYNVAQKYRPALEMLERKLKQHKDEIKIRQQLNSALSNSNDGIVLETFYSDPNAPIVNNSKGRANPDAVRLTQLDLPRLSRMCRSRPTLLLNLHGDILYGRIVLPKNFVKKGASASIWAKSICDNFGGRQVTEAKEEREKKHPEKCSFIFKKSFSKTELQLIMSDIRKKSTNYIFNL